MGLKLFEALGGRSGEVNGTGAAPMFRFISNYLHGSLLFGSCRQPFPMQVIRVFFLARTSHFSSQPSHRGMELRQSV